jgi:hypothetical protein
MTEMAQDHTRLSWVEKEAKRDKMNPSERGGETAGIIGIVLVTLFFYAHQAWSTGFFLPSLVAWKLSCFMDRLFWEY